MPTPPNKPDDPIKHVIVPMMESRSFDQMLGGLRGAIDGLDGVPKDGPPRTNRADGKTYKQAPRASRSTNYDPRHELEPTLHQLEKDNGGFVADFAKAYPFSDWKDRVEITKYFADGELPVLHALAKNFLVCDRWFWSLPGPT